jgi:two-component system response regulator MprA
MDSFLELRRLQGARRPGAPLRVLIVDDDEALRDSVVTFFGRDPRIEVRQAADGFSAGRLVAEFQPDVVILDLLMPGLDGFAVCRSIRSSRRSRHTRILVLTAFASEENVRRATECGADICLAKPVELDELKAKALALGRDEREAPVPAAPPSAAAKSR